MELNQWRLINESVATLTQQIKFYIEKLREHNPNIPAEKIKSLIADNFIEINALSETDVQALNQNIDLSLLD